MYIIIMLPMGGVNSDGSRAVSMRHDGSHFNGQRIDPNSFNFVPRVLLVVDGHAAYVGIVKTTIHVVQRQTCTAHTLSSRIT